MEKLWIVRNNRLKRFESDEINPFDDPIMLYYELFPEVIWENSPQQVELTLVKDNEK